MDNLLGNNFLLKVSESQSTEFTPKQKLRFKIVFVLCLILASYCYYKHRFVIEIIFDFITNYFKYIAIFTGIVAIILPAIYRVCRDKFYNFMDWDIDEDDDEDFKLFKKKYKDNDYKSSVKRTLGNLQYWKCKLCKTRINIQTCKIKNIMPQFAGGTNDISNLQALCKNCEQNKDIEDYMNYIA